MGRRKVIIKLTAADNIAAIARYIESKGMIATADKFADDVYDYLLNFPIQENLILFAESNSVHS